MALKKLMVALSLLAATTLSARAADLAPQPVEPVAPVATQFSWTGFYAGLNAGYGLGSSKLEANTPYNGLLSEVGVSPSVGHWSSNGAVGGGQIGYNYQFNSFVIGAEVDGDFSGISGDLNLLNVVRIKTENQWLASARLRAGYAFDRALLYVTGGVAGGGVKNSAGFGLLGFGYGLSQSETDWGWTAGLGLEYAITDNWSVRLDYRHVGLADNSQTYSIGGVPIRLKYSNDFDLGTVGVNYHF